MENLGLECLINCSDGRLLTSNHFSSYSIFALSPFLPKKFFLIYWNTLSSIVDRVGKQID